MVHRFLLKNVVENDRTLIFYHLRKVIGAAARPPIDAATVDLIASLIVGSIVEILTSAAPEESVGSDLLLMVKLKFCMRWRSQTRRTNIN